MPVSQPDFITRLHIGIYLEKVINREINGPMHCFIVVYVEYFIVRLAALLCNLGAILCNLKDETH